MDRGNRKGGIMARRAAFRILLSLAAVVLTVPLLMQQTVAHQAVGGIELAYDDGAPYKTVLESEVMCPVCAQYQGVRFELVALEMAYVYSVRFYAYSEESGQVRVHMTDVNQEPLLPDPIAVPIDGNGWYAVTMPQVTVTGDFYIWIQGSTKIMPYHDIANDAGRSFHTNELENAIVPVRFGDLLIRASYSEELIVDHPPDAPSNTSPQHGADDVALTPTLRSSAFSDPDRGDSHVASQWMITILSGEYTSPVFDCGVATSLTQINVPAAVLSYGQTYYWRVRYQDDHGAWSGWSSESSFTTGQSPSQPGNVSPTDGSVEVSLEPVLLCSEFSDPDAGDTHAASQWRITATPGDYDSLVFDSGMDVVNLSNIGLEPGVLSASVTYYWQVRHQNNHVVWSDWSAETSFTTTIQDQTPNQTGADTNEDGLPFWVWIAVGAGAIAAAGSVAYLVRRRIATR